MRCASCSPGWRMPEPGILVLDADVAFRTWLEPVLAARGWRTLHAGSCAEAERVAAAAPVDLAIVEGRVGWRWIEWLRGRGQRETPVVCVWAGRPSRADARRLRVELGVAIVMRRPTSADELGGIVEGQLGLAALRADYRHRLPEKLAEIAEAMARAHRAPDAAGDAVA